jgi:hypothetical protein
LNVSADTVVLLAYVVTALMVGGYVLYLRRRWRRLPSG